MEQAEAKTSGRTPENSRLAKCIRCVVCLFSHFQSRNVLIL